jgi:hypothetical protein
MSDSIFLEQRGVPAVCVGIEALMNSVGRGMARALGYPAFPGVVIPKSLGVVGRYYSVEIKQKWAAHVAPEIVKILTSKA